MRKGTRSQLTRWFVWHERCATWVGHRDKCPDLDVADGYADEPSAEWTLRLVPLVYYGIKMGYMTGNTGKQVLKPLLLAPSADAGKEMASSKEQTERIRESCKNNMHVAAAARECLVYLSFVNDARVSLHLLFCTFVLLVLGHPWRPHHPH